MKDRTAAGVIAGVAGGVVMNAVSVGSYYTLRISRYRNLDLMSIAIMGNAAKSPLEVAAALLYDLILAGAIGVIFSHLVPTLGRELLLLKGVFLGEFVSLLAFVTTTLFRMPHLLHVPAAEILLHFVEVSLWGLTTAWTLGWLRGSAIDT